MLTSPFTLTTPQLQHSFPCPPPFISSFSAVFPSYHPTLAVFIAWKQQQQYACSSNSVCLHFSIASEQQYVAGSMNSYCTERRSKTGKGTTPSQTQRVNACIRVRSKQTSGPENLEYLSSLAAQSRQILKFGTRECRIARSRKCQLCKDAERIASKKAT